MISVQNKKMIIPEEERVLGFLGDHLAEKREFFISGDYSGDMWVRLFLRFKSGAENFFVLEPCGPQGSGMLLWNIRREHIFEDGVVQAQLKVYQGVEEIWHSSTDFFKVLESLEVSNPPKIPTEFEELEKKLNEKLETIKQVSVRTPIIGENGNWFFYQEETGAYQDSGISSKGEKGDQGELSDGCVETQHLSANAVTADKIAEHCIGSQQLVNQGILNENLGRYCVSADKIEPECVTSDKLSVNCVTTDKITENAVTADKIAEHCIGSQQLVNQGILNENLGRYCVSADKIEPGCVNSDKLSGGAVTRDKLSQDSRQYMEDCVENGKYRFTLDSEKTIHINNALSGDSYALRAYQNGGVAVSHQDTGEIFAFDKNGITRLDGASRSALTGTESGKLVSITQGVAGTKLHEAVIKGETIIKEKTDGTHEISACAVASYTENGSNILKLKEDQRTEGGLTVSCDGDVVSISGTCTGTNLYALDKLARFDAPFTLHIQVISGSSSGSGMYFGPDILIELKTQTQYFPNGIPNWNGNPRWVANGTTFTEDFSCRIWATPGDSAEIPYEKYTEQNFGFPEEITLYSTPQNEYRDTYDILTGLKTENCAVVPMSTGWLYDFSEQSENVVWITATVSPENKRYYYYHNGAVTDTAVTDWQGKIQIEFSKAELGIASSDTEAQAREKVLSYFGDAFAVVPLKTPQIQQYGPVSIRLPGGECVYSCNMGELSLIYERDQDAAFQELLAYADSLEARITQLENL